LRKTQFYLFLVICTVCFCFFQACSQDGTINKVNNEIKKSINLESELNVTDFKTTPSLDPNEDDRFDAKKQLTKDQLNTSYEFKKQRIGRFKLASFLKDNPDDGLVMSRIPEGLTKVVAYSHNNKSIEKYFE
jgi:hypothetical protein